MMSIQSEVGTETFLRVQRIVMRQLDVCATLANPCARLREDLGADSLDLVELVMSVACEFGDDILDEDFQDVRTLGELAAYIERKCDVKNELVYP